MSVSDVDLQAVAARLVPRLELIAELAGMKPPTPSGSHRQQPVWVGAVPPMQPPAASRGSWRDRAACASQPALDFIEAPGEEEAACCASCQVVEDCQQFAQSSRASGMYGGVIWRAGRRK